MRRIDVTPGDQYARLTVIEEVIPRGRYRFVRASCECGNIKIVGLNDIRSGKTTSCGCYRNQRVRETCLNHGMSNTPEYRAWWDMVSRCTNHANPFYYRYGARGIVVCDLWQNNFASFLNHIGRKPHPRSTLDRIDNNSGYFPGNVRWTTPETNRANRCNSKRWIIDNIEYVTLRAASETLGVSESALKSWCKGWKCYRTGKTHPPRENCGVRKLYAE